MVMESVGDETQKGICESAEEQAKLTVDIKERKKSAFYVKHKSLSADAWK